MRFVAGGRGAYAYTGGRPPVPGRPALLLVHGAGNDHSVWALQSRYFAHHGRRVVALDLPGHGRSDGPALTRVEAIAAWLGDVADALDLTRYALAGHSLGALAALEHAAQRQDRVVALALLGPAAPMAVGEALLDAAAHEPARAAAMITAWSHSPARQMGTSPVPGTWLAGNALQLLARTPDGVLHSDLAACNGYEGADRAARAVRCPALFILGARDQMAPPGNAATLQAAIVDATTVRVPDAGHALMTEQPGPVLDALRAFLDQADPARTVP